MQMNQKLFVAVRTAQEFVVEGVTVARLSALATQLEYRAACEEPETALAAITAFLRGQAERGNFIAPKDAHDMAGTLTAIADGGASEAELEDWKRRCSEAQVDAAKLAAVIRDTLPGVPPHGTARVVFVFDPCVDRSGIDPTLGMELALRLSHPQP